jgi:PKD repeat protein
MNRSLLKIRTLTFLCASSFILLFSAQTVQAQQWVELLTNPDANFYEIRDAFNNEWAGKPYAKSQGYKQFMRWEHFWEYRINSDGTFPKYADMWKSYKDFAAQPQLRAGGGSGGNWTPIGPFNYNLTQSWSPGTGRIQVVTEDPSNSNTIYAGAPDGGIWKSTDGGGTWIPLGDNLPVIGVSGIAVDYANSNTVYISTGDPDGGDSYSIGIWKSVDGGTTFNQVGGPGGGNLNRIMIDPVNSNNLFVVSSTGVWRSSDAGLSWTNVQAGNFDDIIYKPGDSQTIYAVTDEEFYLSTDGGTVWAQTTNGLPATSGRLQIAVTPADNSYVYVLSAATNNDFQGIYRSTDSGVSFSARNTTTDIFDGSGQAYYDMAIAASATDANTIYTGCLNLWRSTDGGNSFNNLNSWSNPGGASYTHADIHYLRAYGGNLYCGSDGGVYKSTNSGNAFTDITDGVQVGQFYSIAGTEQDPDVICGGLQDNGGFAYNGTEWKCYYGADGMESAVDNNNSNLIFGMIQFGSLYRSTNGGNNLNNLGSPESGAWVTPMQADPNADRLVCGYNDLHEYDYAGGWNQISTFNFSGTIRKIEIYPGNSNTIYVASYDELHKTTNGGGAFTNITGTLNVGSGITSIECHPTDINRVWVTVGGTAGSRVYYSANGGTAWTDITGSMPNLPINIIKYEIGASDGLYIGTDIGVYYRDNNTGDWLPFNNQLPNVKVTDLEINQTAGLIRAGTYGRGVWSTGTFDQLSDNAGITSIIQPNGNRCGQTFIPEVTLNNAGTNTLTSATITYDVDGAGTQVYSWTGSLAPFASTVVTLASMTTTAGSHVFNAVVSNPNGAPDLDPTNDAASSNFNITLGGSAVTLTLNTDCWGSEITWEVQDGGGLTVASGGPYSNVTGGETLTETICLPDGCYDFIINDSYGDGLNGTPAGCAVNGSYSLEDPLSNNLATMIAVDGAFGNQEINNFCLVTGLSAAFSGTPTSICAGNTVAFTDGSSGTPTSWTWTFPGGTPATSALQNPTVTYNTAGTYDVTLLVGDGSTTDNITNTAYITVISGLTVTTSATNESCAGTADGTATASTVDGSGPYTYLWDDGSTQTTATATGLAPGTYNCTITDAGGCVGSAAATVGSAAGSQIDFTLMTDCWGSEITWEVQDGGGTVLYSGGPYPDATPLGTGVPITEIWCLAPGCYDFIINDSYGDGMGGSQWGSCDIDGTYSIDQSGSNLATILVADFGNQEINNFCIGASPLAAAFTGNPTTICEGETVNFTDNSTGTVTGWTWAFPGGTPATSTVQNPTVTYATAGVYDVTLDVTDGSTTDAVTQTGYITVTAPPVVTISTINVSCNGGCDGVAMTTATGNGPFTYQWDANAGNQITATANGLCAGTYTVTATDANGCTAQAAATITEPTALTITGAVTDATCGQSNGQVCATASGGTPNYSYLWDDPGLTTTACMTSAIAGCYNVTIVDDNGCAATMQFCILDLGSATASISASTNESCSGACDGTATAVGSAGTAPYTYQWEAAAGNQTTATATNLCAGSYTVTVTDALGCSDQATATITSPSAITLTTTTTDANCGQNDGTATVSASGGTGGYTYLWSPTGGTGATATGLPAGTYTLTVTDANGCTAQTTAIVNNGGGFTASATQTNVSCFGACDGTATANTSGGSAPLTYQWGAAAGNQTTATATNLCAGTYTVTATDALGCTSQATATITEPSAVAATTSSTDANCGANDGTATVTASGGTSGYTYLWSPTGGTGATATALAAGTYSATVTDANGCTAQASVTVNNVGGLSVTTSQADENCGAADGTATATPIGGSGSYSYAWSSGGNAATETGLSGGTYTVIVTDLGNGCIATASVTIGSIGAVTAIVSPDLTICVGSQLTLTASGGTSYSWDDGSGVISTNSTVTVFPTATTIYTATVSDGNCSDVESVVVTVVSLPSTTISGNTSLCLGESTTLTASGGTSFLWAGGETTTSITVSPSTSTTYTVVGTANGCSSPTANVVVTVDDLPVAVAGSNVTTTYLSTGANVNFNSSGSQGTNFDWDFDDTNTSNSANPSHSYAAAGLFTVELSVTNGGCQIVATDTILIEVLDDVGIENGALNAQVDVYPNPTSSQLNIAVTDWSGKALQLRLTDTRGRLVYMESFEGLQGDHLLSLDLEDEARGVYFLQMTTDDERKTVKVLRQ